ncbi:MAG TPA: ABC transporter permease [Thermoplasmata archaeon]|nr:ABC transporter permease [Thermoplasmata archaeon]
MRYAFDSVRRRRGRSLLTALGIGLATALVVTLLAVSEGVRVSSADLAQTSGVDLLATSANTSLASGTFPPIPGAHALPGALSAADPNVESASPWLVAQTVFANDTLRSAAEAPNGTVPAGWGPTGSGTVGWVPDDNAGLDTPTLLAGDGFSDPGDPHYANGTYRGPVSGEVVVDQALAALLRVGVGDRIWTAPTAPAGPAGLSGWFANATPLTVVGISTAFWLVPSALLAFLYLSELQTTLGESTGGSDPASVVLIHLSDASDPDADRARLATALPALTVFTVANILGAVANAVALYRTFGTLVGAIGVVVAALFTTTVLLMSVDDRSRELAVLRAIGVPRRTVGRYVVEEGLLLAGAGLAIGFPAGIAGALGLNAFLARYVTGLPAGFSFIAIDPIVAVAAAVEVAAIGLVASLAPAARAMTIPVARELRAP